MSETTMDTQTLRRRIAEALGYTLAYGPDVDETTDEGVWYVMHSGKICGHTFCFNRDLDEAWQTVNTYFIEDSAQEGAPPFPDWPHDPGAALALMPLDCSLTRVDPRIWPQAWECTSPHPTERGEYPISITRYGPTPALAICHWFLAYQEARRE